jgi:aryl-alcohol dehydrogenase-like predicted oxidoreductase
LQTITRFARAENHPENFLNKRNLGNSSLLVSEIGLGCNALNGRIDMEASRKVVHAALDTGITFFDTSDMYGDDYGSPSGSEVCLGKVLGARRKDIVLATKFGNERKVYDANTKGGSSRRVIMIAVEDSLKRLNTDYIDLYQAHKPDPNTPIEETMRALDDLVKQGKVRHIGCSNYPAWRVVDAQWTAKHHNLTPFVSCQDEYSAMVRRVERDMLPAMQQHGIGLLPYFPLAAGLLTGKYKRNVPFPDDARLKHNKRWSAKFITEQNWTLLEGLDQFCSTRGVSLLRLAFGWLLAKPIVGSVIAGASKPEQVKINVDAAQSWQPTAEDIAEIDRITASA